MRFGWFLSLLLGAFIATGTAGVYDYRPQVVFIAPTGGTASELFTRELVVQAAQQFLAAGIEVLSMLYNAPLPVWDKKIAVSLARESRADYLLWPQAHESQVTAGVSIRLEYEIIRVSTGETLHRGQLHWTSRRLDTRLAFPAAHSSKIDRGALSSSVNTSIAHLAGRCASKIVRNTQQVAHQPSGLMACLR